MNPALKAYVALDSGVDRMVVETLLTSSSQLSVSEYAEVDGTGISRDSSDVLVVACHDYTSAIADYVSHAAALRSSRPVVVLARDAGNGYVAEAFQSGADDIITLPDSDDLAVAAAMSGQVVFALEKAVARKRGSQAATEHPAGQMICVLGLKGGSGKTLTTANLSVALAAAGSRVVVIDLDLQFGDLGLALGLRPERTLYDLVRAGGSIDAEKIEDFMAVHASGARALLAPTRPDRASAITADFLREVYRVLRESYDFVIIDTPPSFTPEVIGAIDASTSVCMVAALDSLSLKNTKVGLETLERMEYRLDDVRLVLNRADSKVGIASEDVVSIMGKAPAVLVPSDRNVTKSINQGEPIVLANRRADAAKAFQALAHLYQVDNNAPVTSETPRKRRRLFRRPAERS